jgi:hypothetical protein
LPLPIRLPGLSKGFWSKIPKLGVKKLSKRVVRAKQVKRPRLFCSLICEIVLLADPTTIDAIMAGPAHRALCRPSENIRVTRGKVALHVAAMQQVHLVQWLAACSCRRQGRAVVQAGAGDPGKGPGSGHLEVATTLENYASAYRGRDIRAKHA